ncbi:MAG: nucleotidyl transferase AbiEii/AbiGii toxin family protein [Candidatus Brocadiaceae bacterium]
MIPFTELSKKSVEWGVPIETVDKDWVLGHYLNGLYNRSLFKDCFRFKGGTCLRKLYFKHFRFSEDLDFSSLSEVEREKIKKELEIIHDIIYQNAGISFGHIQIKDMQSNDQLMGYEFKIPFWGAKHRDKRVPHERWRTSIKIDISLRESILSPPVSKNIFHSYSDSKDITAKVLTYSIEEIYAEKLRTILQRGWPRDYYDLWYLSVFYSEKLRFKEIASFFEKKCKLKEIEFKRIDSFFHGVEQVKENWKPSLGSHLRDLPDVDKVLSELMVKLEKLFSENSV